MIVVVAVFLLLLQLFASDKIAMATLGVKEVSPAEEPELHGIIERLCVQADLPKPRVCVMETLDAERLRDGQIAQEHDRVRHAGHHRRAQPGRARRRDGARAHARDQPRRDGDDAGQLLRDAGLDDRPVRLLLRRRLRERRRGAGHHGRRARVGRRVRDLLPAAAGALALPRVRRRPRLGDPHGPPQRAGLGPDQDQRRDRAGPQRRPAPGRGHERLLHHPRAQEEAR